LTSQLALKPNALVFRYQIPYPFPFTALLFLRKFPVYNLPMFHLLFIDTILSFYINPADHFFQDALLFFGISQDVAQLFPFFFLDMISPFSDDFVVFASILKFFLLENTNYY